MVPNWHEGKCEICLEHQIITAHHTYSNITFPIAISIFIAIFKMPAERWMILHAIIFFWKCKFSNCNIKEPFACIGYFLEAQTLPLISQRHKTKSMTIKNQVTLFCPIDFTQQMTKQMSIPKINQTNISNQLGLVLKMQAKF